MNQRTFHSHMKRNVRKNIRKHSGGVRIVAVFLATVMAFSALSANVSSIVTLLDTKAAGAGDHDEMEYREADLTLYDYFSDGELDYNSSGHTGPYYDGDGYESASNGANKNFYFNDSLQAAGYASRAQDATHTWDGGNLYYFPLYVGIQHNNANDNISSRANDAKYNYSLTVNSEADTAKSAAAQGLVDDTLVDGTITQGGHRVKLPYFDEEFLSRKASDYLSGKPAQALGKVYSGYKFRFVKNSNTSSGYYNYYEYNSYQSAGMGLSLPSKSTTFTAGDQADGYTTRNDVKGYSGFFPIRYFETDEDGHNYDQINFCYGAKFEMKFTMSNTGTIIKQNTSGQLQSTKEPILFTFSGDDDVWVYVDGKLVLDIGGAHGAVGGEDMPAFDNNGNLTNAGNCACFVDFSRVDKSGNAKTPGKYVTYVKDTPYYNHWGDATYSSGSVEDLSSVLNDDFYRDATKEHTLTVFYLERGTRESNCHIAFNFQVADAVTVTNTLDSSGVNETLRDATLTAAQKDAAAFKIMSNGGTSAIASPDAGTIDNNANFTGTTATGKVTISYNSNGADSGSYPSREVDAGTTIKLPEGYRLVKDGYYLTGWIKDNTGDIVTTYTANADATFYAQWKRNPITVAVPNAPSLLQVNGLTINSIGNGNDDLKYNSGKTFFNATKNPPGNLYFKDNNSNQVPGNDSGYQYSAAGGATVNSDNFKMENGYFFVMNHTGNSTNTITRYALSDITINPDTGEAATSYTSYDTWIYWYNQLYLQLVTSRTRILAHDAANSPNVSTEVTTYNTALTNYYNMLPDSTSVNDLKTAINNLNTNIPAVVYDYSYAYSDISNASDRVTFYVYSDSAPTVSITNAPSGITGTGYTVSEAAAAPAGTTPPTGYTATKYYTVTVAKNIITTATPQGGGVDVVTTEATEISIGTSGGTYTKTSAEIATALQTKTHYCCYAGEGWRDIDDPAVTYSVTATKKVWFYGDPGTISYSAASGVYTGTVTASSDITNYYMATVPSEITKTEGETTTTYSAGDISLSFTLNSGSVSTTVPTGTAYGYFNTGTSNGWHALKTVVVQVPNWSDGTARTWWYAMYLYVEENKPSPLTCGTWPNTTIQMESIASPTIAGNDGTGSYPKFYYTYVPSATGIKHVFKSTTDSSDEDKRSEEITTIDKDILLTFKNQVSSRIYYNDASEITSSSNSTYYSLTATYKAAGAASGGATPMNLTPRRSSGNNNATAANDSEKGQFVNAATSAGAYDTANGVNFKLFNTADPTQEGAESIVRRTNEDDGEFYLHFGQSGKFTYQFQRATGMKIAQTGNYSTYTARNVVDVASENKKSPMYERYRTTWQLSDAAGSKITLKNTREDYNVYNYNGNSVNFTTSIDGATDMSSDFSSSTYSDAGAIYFNNIAQNATGIIGIDLTAKFTSSIITGDLYIKKVVDDKALESYTLYKTAHSEYAPEFKFNVRFYDIFGGGEDATGVYDGVYYVKDPGGYYYGTDGNKYKRTKTEVDGDSLVHTYQQVNPTNNSNIGDPFKDTTVTATTAGIKRTAGDYVMTIPFTEASKTDGDPVVSGGTVKMLVIEDIPVDTKFVVKDIVLTDTTTADPKYDLKTITRFDTNAAGTSLPQTGDPLTQVDYSTETTAANDVVKGTLTTESGSAVKEKMDATLQDAVSQASGAIAEYRTVANTVEPSGTISSTVKYNGADTKLNFLLGAGQAYLIIGKKVNHLYYYENDSDTGNSDNPAGLLGTGLTVGGQMPAADDVNGYQRATNANQTFIFKIDEYEPNGSGGWNSIATFYETISFGTGDTVGSYKYRVIDADASHKYEVTEVTDWSWKYTGSAASALPDGNSTSGVTATVTVFDATGYEVTPIGGASSTQYANAAKVEFYNTKNPATRDVEGDTDIAENTVTIQDAA
ncbi:MAG: hypothetical protein II828_10260 [Clostridia bacterium]|nr:hypothetical protein [Clostridia bacterium]